MASTLYLRQLECGPMQNFVYLIGDPTTRQAAVVDPAWDISGIVQAAAEDGYTLTKVLITHTHQDHTGGQLFGYHIPGVVELLQQYDVPVYVHQSEAHVLKDIPPSSKVPTRNGQVIEVGKQVAITLLHTPGHTPGSQCFLVQNRLIAGDTLFIGSCGRVDLPNSSPEDMYHSLTNVLMRLDDDTVLYPGHNYAWKPSSTIGEERRHNPYVQFTSLHDFLRAMGY
ncbi:MAG: MBL fold metallo-hydrolase [Candidatus Tectimicrobiota bacterium]|nr:MAG: MBL fold metallo-hydrolase [Candidatus Tectomicrobia bacterium]